MSLQQQVACVYQHTQTVPSTTWVMVHNLGFYPAIDTFIDYQGEVQKVLPLGVTYADANTCTITFSQPRTGVASAS